MPATRSRSQHRPPIKNSISKPKNLISKKNPRRLDDSRATHVKQAASSMSRKELTAKLAEMGIISPPKISIDALRMFYNANIIVNPTHSHILVPNDTCSAAVKSSSY